MQTLNGKLAMVTGAAGVIGRAVAERFAADGITVLAVDIAADRLTGFSTDAIVPFPIDIGDPKAVSAACNEVRARFGPIDILVNNAGLLSTNRAAATSDEEWQRVIGVNLSGAFYLCREWIGDMTAKGWGRIVNVGSAGAKTGGITTGPAYVASKAGIHGLTFSLSIDGAPHGVTANGIAPAFVKTPMVLGLPESEQKLAMSKIPVRRFCEPEEIAHLVRFLIDPMSGFITGEIIDINGGVIFD